MLFKVHDYRLAHRLNTVDKADGSKGQPQHSRDALYGDGFFTTAIIDRSHIKEWPLHLDRLKNSAARLKFNHFDARELEPKLLHRIEDIDKGVVRITVTRQQKNRGYQVDHDAQLICSINISDQPISLMTKCELFEAVTPISVNSQLAGIKHLNRLDNVLAANEISAPNQEAIMLNGNKLICGSRSNLFVYRRDQWHTPILSDCGIEGITKNRVIESLRSQGISCQLSSIYRDDVKEIRAAFITNSLLGVCPAESFFGRRLDLNLSSKIRDSFEQ